MKFKQTQTNLSQINDKADLEFFIHCSIYRRIFTITFFEFVIYYELILIVTVIENYFLIYFIWHDFESVENSSWILPGLLIFNN